MAKILEKKIIIPQTTSYVLDNIDYMVFLINTDMYTAEEDLQTCTNEYFVKSSIEQKFFYTLDEFVQEFNDDNGISPSTDFMRIIKVDTLNWEEIDGNK